MPWQKVIIAGAQQTYLALADLRLELEQKEQEFLLAYNIAAQAVQESLVQAEAANQYTLSLGEEGEEENFAIDVNYWSQGRLHEHINNLEKLSAQLRQSGSQLSLAQVQEINKAIAQEQSKREEIVEQARLALLSSQMRVEIADLVVSSLEDLGYTLVNPDTDAIYAENDQRNAYVVKVKNLAGDEVVTVIKPEVDFGSNVVSINAFSEVLVDEKAAQQNAQAIFASLEAAGIQGSGEFTCKSKAQEKYRNPQAIKQRDLAQPS